MKNKFLVIALALIIALSTSCAEHNKQVAKKKAIGGVESSVYEMGDIKNIKVTVDNSNIKAGCSNSSPNLMTSNINSKYSVINQVADWYALNLPNSKIGFIHKSKCKPIVVNTNKAGTPSQAQYAAPMGTTAPKTPSANTNSSKLTSAEQQMLNLINASRSQNHLAPLKVDMELTNVARIKAQDMIDNHYFSHFSPKYGSPFDMMKAFGVNYVQAGENIAGNQSVPNAENALMNSPGHRRNILSPNFTHIGIGIKTGGPYGNMFSQMFISKPQ